MTSLTFIENTSSASAIASTATETEMQLAICNQGTSAFEHTFPGEPFSITAQKRSELWQMYFINNNRMQVWADEKTRKLNNYSLSISILSFVLGITAGSGLAFLLQPYLKSNLPDSIGFPIFMVSLIAPCALGLWGAMSIPNRIFPEKKHIADVVEHVSQNLWPKRFANTLRRAVEGNVELSTELQAFQLLLCDVREVKSWGQIPPVDQVGMATLADDLAHQVGGLYRGARMGLSGESSELVHRAGDVVMPGHLETLISTLKNPPSINV